MYAHTRPTFSSKYTRLCASTSLRLNFFILLFLLLSANSIAQRKCGAEQLKAARIATDANWQQKFEEQRASLQAIANNYIQQQTQNAAAKTTATSPIPVIFHIVINATQLAKMGGYEGARVRCDSQIAVLNRDFNRENRDSTLIPAMWKSLYASSGIRFGLAHTQPNGWSTPGYEIIVIRGDGFYPGSNGDYADVKYSSRGGIDSWDVTKYLNIWCMNFADGSGNLGFTVNKAATTPGAENEEGITLTWLALGTQTVPATFTFPSGGSFISGRTLTHEMGHFFNIWHTWGDDFGKCAWNGGGDDGIADTPPEADHKYGTPADTIFGGTVYDACKDSVSKLMQPIGVATHDYMNYTDDIIMAMFTTQQAAVMASNITPGGRSYSLTQNPALLLWPANAGTSHIGSNNGLIISPNPSSGIFRITFNDITDELKDITVTNTIGQQVQSIDNNGSAKDISIDLSVMSKGIYFVRCNFASGSITRKILLQ